MARRTDRYVAVPLPCGLGGVFTGRDVPTESFSATDEKEVDAGDAVDIKDGLHWQRCKGTRSGAFRLFHTLESVSSEQGWQTTRSTWPSRQTCKVECEGCQARLWRAIAAIWTDAMVTRSSGHSNWQWRSRTRSPHKLGDGPVGKGPPIRVRRKGD